MLDREELIMSKMSQVLITTHLLWDIRERQAKIVDSQTKAASPSATNVQTLNAVTMKR